MADNELPPGATLVTPGVGMELPEGATLLTPPGGTTIDSESHPNPIALPTFLQAVHAGISALPTIGGIAGGALGAGAGGLVSAPAGGLGAIPAAAGGAALGGASGQAVKQLIQRAFFPDEAPKGIGESARRMGMDAAINGASELVPRAVFAGAAKVAGPAVRMVQGIVKPSRSLQASIPGAMRAILDEGVHTSESAREAINDLNRQVADHIATHAQQGTVVPTKPIFDGLDAVRAKALRNLDAKGVAAVDEYRAGLESNPHLIAQPAVPAVKATATTPAIPGRPAVMKTELPVDIAHQIKVESGKGLPWGERGGYREEAGKAGVTALREGISAAVPEVGEANSRIHNLLGAESALRGMEAREGNKNPLFNLPVMLSLLAGHGPAEIGGLGLLAKVLTAPGTGLRVAQGVNAVARRPAVAAALNEVVPTLLKVGGGVLASQ